MKMMIYIDYYLMVVSFRDNRKVHYYYYYYYYCCRIYCYYYCYDYMFYCYNCSYYYYSYYYLLMNLLVLLLPQLHLKVHLIHPYYVPTYLFIYASRYYMFVINLFSKLLWMLYKYISTTYHLVCTPSIIYSCTIWHSFFSYNLKKKIQSAKIDLEKIIAIFK